MDAGGGAGGADGAEVEEEFACGCQRFNLLRVRVQKERVRYTHTLEEAAGGEGFEVAAVGTAEGAAVGERRGGADDEG